MSFAKYLCCDIIIDLQFSILWTYKNTFFFDCMTQSVGHLNKVVMKIKK